MSHEVLSWLDAFLGCSAPWHSRPSPPTALKSRSQLAEGTQQFCHGALQSKSTREGQQKRNTGLVTCFSRGSNWLETFHFLYVLPISSPAPPYFLRISSLFTPYFLLICFLFPPYLLLISSLFPLYFLLLLLMSALFAP